VQISYNNIISQINLSIQFQSGFRIIETILPKHRIFQTTPLFFLPVSERILNFGHLFLSIFQKGKKTMIFLLRKERPT
jgi:hypothetical protein